MDKILRYSDESMCWEYFKMSGSKNCESLFIVCFGNVVEILVGNFKRASLSRLTILLKNKSDIYDSLYDSQLFCIFFYFRQ